MKLVKIKNSLKVLTDLKFAIAILGIIAISSSLGSVIEQDESLDFYQENYPSARPIYGFLDWKFLLQLGLDHVYTTWWFFFLLTILAISLISCTMTRQFPLFLTSKDYFFKKQKKSFSTLSFFVQMKNISYLNEMILMKIQTMNFYIYQKGNCLYGYKGLIGRLSPILVHLSLLIILGGSSLGAFYNFKAQEVLPKGELFHIQNPIKIGFLTPLPDLTTRVNDFWVEYEKNRIHQFYSNLSILDSFGNELKEQTISVNNPLRYKNIDFYQSDWSLLGIRVENIKQKEVFEFPIFSLKKGPKSWVTWIPKIDENENFTLLFDQLQNVFFIYDQQGNFINVKNLGDFVTSSTKIIEILPSTGLLIKYDPSISFIYFGFGLLMITACLSYLPYTQIWVLTQSKQTFLGSSTNRGKIQLEIEFENFIREMENKIRKQKLKKISSQ
jgi:cytochrome c biogenesis protein